jgi:hypothetical protein
MWEFSYDASVSTMKPEQNRLLLSVPIGVVSNKLLGFAESVLSALRVVCESQ